MKKQKQKHLRLAKTFLAIFFIVFFLLSFGVLTAAEKINISAHNTEQVRELEYEVEEKKLEIEKIQKKLDVYEKNLENKRQEKITLQNELQNIAEKIEQLQLEIDKVNLEIDTTNLEIQSVLLQILDKEELIDKQKKQLGELIRQINFSDQKSYLDILITHKSFSEFFDGVTQVEQVESSLKKSLDEVKILKQELEKQKNVLEKKSEKLNKLQKDLKEKKAKLDSQETAKTYYLIEARRSEQKFQELIRQAKLEQQEINNEIVSLEKTIRTRLQSKGETFSSTGQLVWPVPKNVITARFHDPDYPFRHIFEHPAIDIRAGQGTPVKAADSGYVGKIKNGGATGYSYIMLIHDDGLATVYGHVSKIYVETDTYVNKGDIIGLSGGMPGTSGAGRLSTGPHMHFEVRLNGIPVNPLDYLP